jgi:hypothetical protein
MKQLLIFSVVSIMVVAGIIIGYHRYTMFTNEVEFTVESIDENQRVSGYTLEDDGLFTTITYIKCPKYLLLIEDGKAYLDRREIKHDGGHDLEIIHVDNILPQDK